MAAKPDAGWSWVIAFSCSFIHLALFGIFRSAGVIFVALLDTYDTTREEAAWPFSLCSAIFQLTAPLASVASRYFSVRKICLFGSLVATIGIACCYFAKNVRWIIIFYGIIHGLGFGLVAALVPVIVNQYFVRYRATGVGIAFSGGTVSTFVFPVAMEFFLHLYGLQGTFLILGGVVMNTLVASSMLRAPPWLKKKKKKEEPLNQNSLEKGAGDCKTALEIHKNGKSSVATGEHYKPPDTDQTNNAEGQYDVQNDSAFYSEQNHPVLQDILASPVEPEYCANQQLTKNAPVPNSNGGTNVNGNVGNSEGPGLLEQNLNSNKDLSELCNANSEKTCLNICLENETVQKTDPLNLNNEKSRTNNSAECVALLPPQVGANGCSDVKNKHIPKEADCTSPTIPLIHGNNAIVVKKKDPSAFQKKQPHPWRSTFQRFTVIGEMVEVLCHPMFHILTLSMCFFFLTVHTFFMVIVDFAKDKGIPESYAIYVLSVFSATDLLGRAGLGWVTDRNYIKRKNMVMMNMGAIGLLNHFYPMATTITGLFTIAGLHGLAVGSSITLFFVLQAEYLGMKKLPLVIGMASFFNGMTTFFRPAMTGLFRDEIGSYDWMFHFLGILMMLIAAAWLAEPWLTKRFKNFDNEDAMSSRFTDVRKSSC